MPQKKTLLNNTLFSSTQTIPMPCNHISPSSSSIHSVIYLRAIQLSDAPRVKTLMTMAISRQLSIAPINKINEAQDFILGKNSNQNIRLAISHSKYGLIGGISYCLQKTPLNQIYILFSYWVGEDYQRQGYTFNALNQLFKQFSQQGNPQLLAKVYPSNVPSQNLLKKLGFRYDELSTSKDPSVFIHFTRKS
ncbi:GNAT family N-acetyltransferase [uncultured Shewanella sp.]|uniref:GNAT family N-acetyltransferase n=1 Tax=uncultured Shewanella sp. TaxID=173975 RepID=UPI00263A1211|nr:GNAT family N-acetyltransferase [uncultured Shewanella sp.]